MTPDLACLLQIGLGSIAGAMIASFALRRPRSRFTLVTVDISVCFAIGIVAMVGFRWPNVPIWAGIGLLSSAVPITFAAPVETALQSTADVRRAAADLIIHVGYGVTFAVLGFVCALGADRLLDLAT